MSIQLNTGNEYGGPPTFWTCKTEFCCFVSHQTDVRLIRRISILHGRPSSIVHTAVDNDMPVDMPDLVASGTLNKFQNYRAIIECTLRLGDIAHVMYANLLSGCAVC